MEARNRNLSDWFTRIRTRQVTLPRFQRYEAWSHNQITSLLNTVIQLLPAGAVLILEVGDKEAFVSRPMEGAPDNGERITEQLLDGQQRLTSLWRSLTNNYDERSYFVCFELDEETGSSLSVTSQSRWLKNGNRYPMWADDPVQLWNKKLLPIHLIRPEVKSTDELKEWAKLASNGDTDVLMDIVAKGGEVRNLFSSFNIPFLSLPVTTNKETALNVFIQMNTSATPLSAYDIVVAQVEAGAGQSLHELIDALKQDVPEAEQYLDISNWMMSVAAIFQEKPPTRATFLSNEFSNNLMYIWNDVKKGIQLACKFLAEEKIFDNKRLPTEVVLYPLAALWSVAPDGLDAEGGARVLLRKYLWRSFFTERYEKTSATRALVDFRQLKALMLGHSTDVPLIFNEEHYPIPSIEELIPAGWPTRKDRLPRALLALALRNGGADFADSQIISRDNIVKREYHHIFPNAWLKRKEYSDEKIFKSLNCALVTWRTNRNMSDKAPATYISDRLEKASLGEQEVISRLKSHLIPYDEIMNNDYEGFLTARAKLMDKAMRALCSGAVS